MPHVIARVSCIRSAILGVLRNLLKPRLASTCSLHQLLMKPITDLVYTCMHAGTQARAQAGTLARWHSGMQTRRRLPCRLPDDGTDDVAVPRRSWRRRLRGLHRLGARAVRKGVGECGRSSVARTQKSSARRGPPKPALAPGGVSVLSLLSSAFLRPSVSDPLPGVRVVVAGVAGGPVPPPKGSGTSGRVAPASG